MVRELSIIAALTFICCSAALAQTGEQSGKASAMTAKVGADAPEIVPGILERERACVLQKILKAQAQGCGIAGYMNAFRSLQQSISKGEAESVIRPRLETISKAVDDQLERSKVLKTQRPTVSAHQGSGGHSEPESTKNSKSDSKEAAVTEKPKAVTPQNVGVGAYQPVPEGRFKDDAKLFGH